MARIALDERNRAELRGRMFAELAQYLYPKRKALEHLVEAGTFDSWLLGRAGAPSGGDLGS